MEQKEQTQHAIVKAKKTGELYLYHGEGKFENITTGVKGIIKEEDAKKFFVIPVIINKFAEDNPIFVSLIRAAGLSQEI
jgi:hypothetical protein